MWQFHYIRAQELARERHLEAERDHLLRLATEARRSGPRFGGLRLRGAVAAASQARRLDDAAAREVFTSNVAAKGPDPIRS